MSTGATAAPKRKVVFVLNDRRIEVDTKAGALVVDYLRDDALLKGTKVGCREGDCGACTVIVGTPVDGVVDYRVVTSCLLPMGELHGKHLVTIEGLNRSALLTQPTPEESNDNGLTPVQRAIIDEGATQCGFCTPGIVVALTGFLLGSGPYDDDGALAAVAGNICRCTGYAAIKRAARRVVRELSLSNEVADQRIGELVSRGVVPAYFEELPAQLAAIGPAKGRAGIGARRVVVGGGTDLFVQRPDELVDADLFFMSRRELGNIWCSGDFLYLGAGATVTKLQESPLVAQCLPAIGSFVKLISSEPIRNRATVGGNIVNASPIGDLSILLLALDAELGLKKGRKKRGFLLRHFFKGYKRLDLEAGEIMEWVRIPPEMHAASVNFEKVSKRTHLDIASVNSALAIAPGSGDTIAAGHLAVGGVAPVPLYLNKTSAFLAGRPVSLETAREAARQASEEITPISDVRGSSDYKRLLTGRLVLAHFGELFGLREGLI